MTQDELQNIIDTLEKQTSKEKATFGIYQYGGSTDESYIRADKEGLKSFALELLKASAGAEEIICDKQKSIIPLPYEEDWIDEQSDTVVQYIEPVNKKNINIKGKKNKEGVVERITPYGCFIALAILAFAVIVGLWTILKWVF